MAWLKKPTPKLLFAWLFAFALFLVARPTLAWYLAGLPAILAGELLRLWACGHLEKNKKLTTSGPYAWVQNPLYLGTFLIMLGFCIQAGNLWVLAGGAVVFFAYYIPFKKRREGDRLREIFGTAWEDYAASVPVLFPVKARPYPRRSSERFVPGLVIANSEHGTAVAVVIGLVVMGLRVAFPDVLRLS